MRVATCPASSAHAGRGLAAILTLWLAGAATAGANEIAANAVYGFAEQKIYGMTLTATPGSTATLSGSSFTVKMSTKAAFDSGANAAHNGGLDALQSFVSGSVPLPPAPVENFIGNASPGMSLPWGERVLRQLNATAPGVAGGFDPRIPGRPTSSPAATSRGATAT